MIEFGNGGILVEGFSDLPNPRFKTVYLDAETSSGDPKKKSVNPWKDCTTCGLAFTGDDCKRAWYVPRHLLRAPYVKDLLSNADQWVNHNIKYDANVVENDFDARFEGRYVDTLNRAKLVDSDRTFKGGYGLKTLSEAWLEHDISDYEWRMYPYLEGVSNQDYGRVPLDIIGEYACQDVFTVRDLNDYCSTHMPEESRALDELEQKLTKVLYEIERHGLRVDTHRLKEARLRSLHRMISIQNEIEAELGHYLNPVSSKDLYDLICNRFDLPVLATTKDGNPSFSKDALRDYLQFAGAPVELLEKVIEYRHHSTLDSLFWEPWLDLQRNGLIHPSYNQTLRSARMSSRQPNAQQLSKDAKREILCREGYSFLSFDYKQIEYRLIVHYIKDKKAIAAYHENPDIDYHQWVADLCGTERDFAKMINFGTAYNMGKKKLLTRLRLNKTLAEKGYSPAQMEAFAESVYETYHANLPTLKRVARKCGLTAKSRGYIRDAHGRCLRLPEDRSWVAFNRLVQSEAAEIAKERAVAIYENQELRDLGAKMCAIVHDEFLFEVPRENATRAATIIKREMETMDVDYRVPIRTDANISHTSWAAVEAIAV